MSGALVLFDIDGTLLLSGGAGVRSMTRAFESIFGVADAFAGAGESFAVESDIHLAFVLAREGVGGFTGRRGL